MSSLPEIEVGEDETIKALKDHIETLKTEVLRLRRKYEPEEIQNQPAPVNINLPLKTTIRTTAALIEALERRAMLKVGQNEEL